MGSPYVLCQSKSFHFQFLCGLYHWLLRYLPLSRYSTGWPHCMNGNIRLNTPASFWNRFCKYVYFWWTYRYFLRGNSAIDVQQHDTYFVVAHFHIVMGVAAMFGMFAGVYHWFPKMFGRFMNETLGKIHFGVPWLVRMLYSGLCITLAWLVFQDGIIVLIHSRLSILLGFASINRSLWRLPQL